MYFFVNFIIIIENSKQVVWKNPLEYKNTQHLILTAHCGAHSGHNTEYHGNDDIHMTHTNEGNNRIRRIKCNLKKYIYKNTCKLVHFVILLLFLRRTLYWKLR